MARDAPHEGLIEVGTGRRTVDEHQRLCLGGFTGRFRSENGTKIGKELYKVY